MCINIPAPPYSCYAKGILNMIFECRGMVNTNMKSIALQVNNHPTNASQWGHEGINHDKGSLEGDTGKSD